MDDKIILGWNALMNSAFSQAFMATGIEKYREVAVSNMQFLLKRLGKGDGSFNHTWKNDISRYPAFLDDYAFLIRALILLQQITADHSWLSRAKVITENVINSFGDKEMGLFYYTNERQRDVIVRKKEIFDGAVPSGNAMMAYNLYWLGIYFDEKGWKERSRSMVMANADHIIRFPTSFGWWGCLFLEIVSGTDEIAVIGKDFQQLQHEIFAIYIPHKVLMGSVTDNELFPMLAGKIATKEAIIFLCKDYVCQQPVNSIERFMSLINRD